MWLLPLQAYPAKQAEEIFLLTCEAKKLGRKIACEFINLSSQEVLFHMGAQATGYEKVASGCPDCVTAYYHAIMKISDKAIDCLHERAGDAWLDTNSTLFQHALEYEMKMNDFLTESKNAIEALHDRIWTVVTKIMEDAGMPMSDGLGLPCASSRCSPISQCIWLSTPLHPWSWVSCWRCMPADPG